MSKMDVISNDMFARGAKNINTIQNKKQQDRENFVEYNSIRLWKRWWGGGEGGRKRCGRR